MAKNKTQSAKEFYEANATNLVNVPRPNHPEDPSGWAGVPRACQAQSIAKDVLCMTLWEAFEFAEKYAAATPQATPTECELCNSGHAPQGHLYHLTDDGRPTCKNCNCFSCLEKRGECTSEQASPTPKKCPICDSPHPELHPSMQPDGGEVQICRNSWHSSGNPKGTTKD